LGKSKIVRVIASGDKQREATEAGADLVDGEDMVNKKQSEGWTALELRSTRDTEGFRLAENRRPASSSTPVGWSVRKRDDIGDAGVADASID
jgi:hypothetical protein